MNVPKALQQATEEDVRLFLRNMGRFDQAFCAKMTSGNEFTLRFEVRGSDGKLIHCRVSEDEFDRVSKGRGCV